MNERGLKKYVGWMTLTFTDGTEKKYKDAVIKYGDPWVNIHSSTDTDDVRTPPLRYARYVIEKVDGITMDEVAKEKVLGLNELQWQIRLADIYIHKQLASSGPELLISAAELKQVVGEENELSLEVLYSLVHLYEKVHRVVIITEGRDIKFSLRHEDYG